MVQWKERKTINKSGKGILFHEIEMLSNIFTEETKFIELFPIGKLVKTKNDS